MSLGKARKGLTTSMAAVLVAAVSYGVSSLVVRHTLGFQLASGDGFTSTVTATYSSGACSGAATAGLAPGVTRCLEVTVHNPLSVPITVNSLSIAVGSFAPAASAPAGTCTASTLTMPALAAGFVVPPGGTHTIAAPITLKSGATQSHCEGGTFGLSFGGTATFTDSTTTVLTSAPDPSATPITFTATVSGDDPSVDPSEPAGEVDFYICRSATTCASPTLLQTAHLSTVGGSQEASITTITLVPGTYYVRAEYLGTGTDFTGSSSAVFAQTVVASTSGGGGGGGGGTTVPPPSPASTPPKGAATTILTGTHKGNLTVAPGKSLFLDNGSVDGNVTLGKGSSFAATGGMVRGSISSKGGGAVSLIGTHVTGSVVLMGATTKSELVGKAAAAIHSTKRNAVTHVCGSTIGGNLVYKDNATPIELGGNRGCRGSVVRGSLSVTSNPAAILVDGNVITGAISIAGNKGGALIGNTAGTSCSLGKNSPRVVGRGNKAKKGNSCNASR